MERLVRKYKIGFVDEEDQWKDKFKLRLKDSFEIYNFNLSPDTTIDDIISTLREEEINCLVVDYDLKEADRIQFNGDEIIEHLRVNQPYFPVFILTAKEENDVLDQVEDGDIVRLKEELDSKPNILIQRITNKISSYFHQIEKAEETITKLIALKHAEGLKMEDEILLSQNYQFLDKINPDDKIIPDNLIQPESISKLYEFVKDTKKVLEKLKELNK